MLPKCSRHLPSPHGLHAGRPEHQPLFIFPLQIKAVDPYAELSKAMPEEEIESLVEMKIKSFHGLLTRDVALKLIAKERGLLKEEEKIFKANEVKEGAKKVTIVAEVSAIMPEVTYASGKKSRDVILKDETGEVRLRLWEDDIRRCVNMRTGSKVKLSNAYEKYGALGLGYAGSIEIVEKAGFTPLGSLKPGERAHVMGTISEVNGQADDGFRFKIKGEDSETDAVILDGTGRGGKLEAGDIIVLDNAIFAGGRIEIRADTRMLLKKPKGMVSGKIEAMEETPLGMKVTINGRELSFDRDNAMQFLGVRPAEDIALGTIIGLKKGEMNGSAVAIRVREENGTFIILK